MFMSEGKPLLENSVNKDELTSFTWVQLIDWKFHLQSNTFLFVQHPRGTAEAAVMTFLGACGRLNIIPAQATSGGSPCKISRNFLG